MRSESARARGRSARLRAPIRRESRRWSRTSSELLGGRPDGVVRSTWLRCRRRRFVRSFVGKRRPARCEAASTNVGRPGAPRDSASTVRLEAFARAATFATRAPPPPSGGSGSPEPRSEWAGAAGARPVPRPQPEFRALTVTSSGNVPLVEEGVVMYRTRLFPSSPMFTTIGSPLPVPASSNGEPTVTL